MIGEHTPLLPFGAARVEKEEEDENHEPIVKEINNIGSFTLLINNMVGPAMMGIPRLFQQAGLIPTSCCMLFIYGCATLCGTLFSDAISAIPGNKTFDRHVDFSSAFRLVIGKELYIIAETLFLITCAVQAITAIVESAQSVDGFLASFLIGKTFALQILPSVKFIHWTPELCLQDEAIQNDGEIPETETADCTPFHGAGGLIVSLGFVITTLIFLPLGRGHLKETILVQIVAFLFMCLLLLQFSGEFIVKGFPHAIPLYGDGLSQLAGVLLFNYAYIVTVPSWLNEKQNSVSVNSTIWHASTLSTAIYFGFGIMCAMSFGNLNGNALIMLASTKVHLFTRICAALFGVTIIGSGVPVFCVMIRTAIYHTDAVSYEWSLFLGSVAPYLLAVTLYQGSVLMSVFNWTGLVVNGLVAFILPMYLVVRSMSKRHHVLLASASLNDQDRAEDRALLELARPRLYNASSGTSPDSDAFEFLGGSGGPGSGNSRTAGALFNYEGVSMSPRHHATETDDPLLHGNRSSSGNNASASLYVDTCMEDSSVEPLPPLLEPYRFPIVASMMLAFTVIIGGTICLDIYFGIQPEG